MNLGCVICAELFLPSNEIYGTVCGHMFHFNCLSQWLERSRTCPQCRRKCNDKNIHRLYFNIINVDTSQVNVASLQENLDNVLLKNKENECELEKARKEIEEFKKGQHKTMKIIQALERKVEKKNFLILSFNEQINILKNENKALDDIRKENKALREKILLLESVESLVTSCASEVDRMLKEKHNNETLSVWVAALRKELRACEAKKIDLRNTLKVVNHDMKKERELRKSLEEKINHLESENYRISEAMKTLSQNQKTNQPDGSTTDQISPNCLTQVKRVRLVDSTNTPSPSLSERVKRIEESDSPYFNIKQSCVGLAPLMKFSDKSRTIEENGVENGAVPKITIDLTDKYSIFKKPRLAMQTSQTKSTISNFNGIGGSDRRMETPFPEPRKSVSDRTKSINTRLKNGKLRKTISKGPDTLDRFIGKE